MKTGTLRNVSILLLLYSATVVLNTRFEKSLLVHAEEDLVGRVFGGMRGMVASWAYMKAEEYHHGGLPFLKAMAYHSGGESMVEARQSRGRKEEEPHHAGEAKADLYSRIFSHVKITEHTELNDSEDKEILPWFYIEVKFDPHDVRGYVMGAFFLETLKKYGEELEFLKEGVRNNQGSAEMSAALGEFFYQRKDNTDAILYLSRAAGLWKENRPPNIITTRYDQTDRFQAYYLLGALYEIKGDYPKAIGTYADFILMEPNKVMSDKMERLRAKYQV